MADIRVYRSVADADGLAAFAHSGIEDKGGLDYIEHPRRVAAAVRYRGGVPYLQVAALLHDVVEDTAFTLQMLLDLGFSRDAVEVVDLLTRKSDVSSDDYYAAIRQHPGALLVKECDIRDNLQEWRLAYLPPHAQRRLRGKYAHALEALGLSL